MVIGQHVTIVGAGIGGLATAVALAGRGAKVTVLERADAIAEVGAGLQISPNGLAVLDALGVGDDVRARAVRADAVQLRDYRQGSAVLRLDLRRYAKDQEYLFVHRADLIDALAQKACALGVTLTFGQELTAVVFDGARACLDLVGGTEHDTELLIGADGLRSVLRPALNGAAEPFFTGQVAWRTTVPATGATRHEVDVFMGPGRHLVRYPLRHGDLINIVAVEERKTWAEESWWHTGDVAELRRAFSGFCDEVRDLLDCVESPNLWGLFRHPVAKTWQNGVSALLGDAAHPTLPFLAQGANLALEDAWVLAESLAVLDQHGALARYQALRQPRAKAVIEAANANARNYHLRNPLLRGAAHMVLRGAGAIAPSRVVSQFDWIYRHDVTRS